MSHSVLFELSHSRKRLTYYTQLRERSDAKGATPIDKWIAIYSERVQKLEKQATKLGLKSKLEDLGQQSKSA